MGNGYPELGNEPFYDYKARPVVSDHDAAPSLTFTLRTC